MKEGFCMIDLHTHTLYSDGSSSVEELLTKAEKLHLSLLSITDHDTIQAHFELQNPIIRNLFHGEILSGVELATTYKEEYSKLFIDDTDSMKRGRVLK